MVDAAAGAGRGAREWGFREEPPAVPLTTATTGKTPVLGWESATPPIAPTRGRTSLLPDLSARASLAAAGPTKADPPSAFAGVTGADRTFATADALAPEIARLKTAALAPGVEAAVLVALRRQIVTRQTEWVTKARAEGLREPTGALDPLRATHAEVLNAALWSEAGGTIPRSELARDGGVAFLASVRNALVYRTLGFEAMLASNAGHPDQQRRWLTEELTRRGVATAADASLDVLRATYAQADRDEKASQPTIGLDGHVGRAEDIDLYEREQVVAAMNPGTTLGSVMATYSALASGELDIARMRAMGNAGNAVEGMLGGAGAHLNKVAAEREPVGRPRPDVDDFNRSGLRPRFAEMAPLVRHFEGENHPGNDVWSGGVPRKSLEVRYAERPSDRAPFRLEARSVVVNGKPEMRLFDATGKLFDTNDAVAHDGEPRAIFVMNAHGEIFSSTFQERAYMHHSSLSGGAPVAAAGELIVAQGKIIGITNRSGHYRPDPKLTDQLITSLREQGLDLAGVKVATYRPGGDPFAPEVRVLK